MSQQVKQQTEQEKYLYENRAWNWQWPNGNKWPTEAVPRGPSQAYSGPGKRVVARRATRRARRRAH